MQRVGPDPVQWQTIPGSSGDGDITYGRRGFRDRQVVFSKTYNVENDCLLHFLDAPVCAAIAPRPGRSGVD